MSDLDLKGVEAAIKAFEECPDFTGHEDIKAAIRAYEAYKASVAAPDWRDWCAQNMAKMVGWSPKKILEAWEAHKASAVPDDEVEKVANAIADATRISDNIEDWARAAIAAMRPSAVPMVGEYVADYGPIPDLSGSTGAEELLANSRPSAVPDEVAEVMEWLRETAEGSESTTARTYRRIADLLEQMALGQALQEKHRDALKQLADRENTPLHQSPDTALEEEGDHDHRK